MQKTTMKVQWIPIVSNSELTMAEIKARLERAKLKPFMITSKQEYDTTYYKACFYWHDLPKEWTKYRNAMPKWIQFR